MVVGLKIYRKLSRTSGKPRVGFKMEVLARLVRDTLPSYLSSVPIPRSFSGFASLSGGEWIHLLAFSGAVGLMVYTAVKAWKPRNSLVNLAVEKDKDKVANVVEIEDLAEKDKVCYCRCWRSKKFPLCDGSHGKHNKETGDNVGPLVLKHREPVSSK